MTRMRSSTRIVRAWIVLLSLGGPVAMAQPPEPAGDRPAPKAEVKKSAWLHEVYLEEASEYEFSLDTEKRQGLELRREPVMNWTSGGDYHGDVFVWTHRGRAAIVGCIFSAPQGEGERRVMHEFHSL